MHVTTRSLCFFFVVFAVLPLGAEESPFEAGARPELVLEEGAGEGPAWHPQFGVLFSGGDGHIRHWTPDGKLEIFRENAGSNGLLFDRDGHLLACEPRQRQVTRRRADGRIEVLTDRFEGKRFNQPNDITVDSKGRIYFSDPRYGDRTGMELLDDQGRKVEGVYRIDPDGSVTRIITHEVDRPNGVMVTPDDRYLYVADNNNNDAKGPRILWRFRLLEDGSVDLESQHKVFDWGRSRGPDGMAQDEDGRIYVAGGRNQAVPPAETNALKGGVFVFSPDGELLEHIVIPRDEVTNCAFGGDDRRTLYITAGGTLWKIRTRTPGYLVWPPRP